MEWYNEIEYLIKPQLLPLRKSDILKRILTISFILILTAPFAVPVLLLNYQKKQIKREVMEMIISGMDKKELVCLTFSMEEIKTQLSWHHSAEFEYLDEMYDIVETCYDDDSVSYWCWHDKEEKSIDKKIEGLVNQTLVNNPQNQENQKRINNYFKIHYLPGELEWIVANEFNSKTSFPKYKSSYSSVYISPPSLPPEIV